MIREIRREDIPDWDFGDVAIKTYSLGEQSFIAGLVAKIKAGNTINDIDVGIKEEIGIDVLNVASLASGLQFVKGKDNISFVIKPGLNRIEKTKFCDQDVSFQAGRFLLGKIAELNAPLTEDQKKN